MLFFNKLWAVVINLDKRVDRLNDLLNHLKIKGIDIFRYPAISDIKCIDSNFVTYLWNNELHSKFYNRVPTIVEMSTGERGCSMSHLRIWLTLYKSKSNYVFILEDDVRLVDNFTVLLDFYSNFLPNDFDIFCLDFIHVTKPIPINKYINKAKYFYHTGAYIMTYKCVEKILNYLPIDSPLDHYLSKLAFYNAINIYMPIKPLIYQTKSDSDIIHT